MKHVILYTLKECQHCIDLKLALNNENIVFNNIDVDLDPDEWDRILKITNEDAVPTVLIFDTDAMSGPLFVAGVDFEETDEIIQIIKKHI